MVLNQAYLFLIFIINGIIIGLLFDFFRILRKTFKTPDIITYIQDFLFWILTGFIILYSIFTFNNGDIRIYMFLSIIIGAIFYMTLFSSFIIKINVKIINFIKNIFKQIIKVIITPFKKIFQIFTKFIKNIFNKTNIFSKINIFAKNTKNIVKN